MTAPRGDSRVPPAPRRVPPAPQRVREGHGANCSSLGSVIDALFATAAVSGAVLAAVAAALASEDVRVHEPPPERERKRDAADDAPDASDEGQGS